MTTVMDKLKPAYVLRRPGFLDSGRGRLGAGLLVLVLLIALVGPFVAPHSPTQLIGTPGSTPSAAYPLGTDFLGRDVLSRVLWGGRTVVTLAVAATSLAYVFGASIGLVAGYVGAWIDPVLMRLMDVILAFPPLLFFLIIATSVGSSRLTLIVGVALVQIPGVARIVYSATREVSVRSYVEAAVARGEGALAIIRREILPNILPPVMANMALSLTLSVLLIAAVNFLGVGLQPPAANWALMVSENRPVLPLNPWATVVPAVLIAWLTIGVNLLGDAITHAAGREYAIEEGLTEAMSGTTLS